MSDKKREEIPEPTPRIMVTIDIWLEKTFVPLTGPWKELTGRGVAHITRLASRDGGGKAGHFGPHLKGDSVITWQEHICVTPPTKFLMLNNFIPLLEHLGIYIRLCLSPLLGSLWLKEMLKNRPQVNPITPHNFTGPNKELTGYLFKLKLNLIAALSQISGVHR